MTQPIEQGIPNAVGLHLEEFAHVVAGKQQKIEFCEIIMNWLEKN